MRVVANADTYHVKDDSGHYKGEHYPRKSEKVESKVKQKLRRDGKRKIMDQLDGGPNDGLR
ncbi:MAG: hypothetical protein ABH884_00375 [Candidatus Komeilibacteria bacterium]